MNKPIFKMLVGLPRSGKSTWCEQHKNSNVIVSNDWIRENILGTTYANNANAIIWSITDSTLRIVLGQGKNAVLDGINHTREVRRFYYTLARQYNAHIQVIYFDTPIYVCLERNMVDKKIPDVILRTMSMVLQMPSKLYIDDDYDELIIVKHNFHENNITLPT